MGIEWDVLVLGFDNGIYKYKIYTQPTMWHLAPVYPNIAPRTCKNNDEKMMINDDHVIFWVPFSRLRSTWVDSLGSNQSPKWQMDFWCISHHFTSCHQSPCDTNGNDPPDWYGGFPKIWVPDSRYFQIIHRKFLYCLYWAIYWGSPLWFQTLLRLFQAMRLSNAEIALF